MRPLKRFRRWEPLGAAPRTLNATRTGGWHPCLRLIWRLLIHPMYLQTPGKIGASWNQVPVLSPHEVFSAVWRAGPLQRSMSLFGPSGNTSLENFWRHATANLEWAKLHPATQGLDEDGLSKLFPMFFFIDGVEVYTNNEYVIWCWSMLPTSGSGDSWDTRFPMFRKRGPIMTRSDKITIETIQKIKCK